MDRLCLDAADEVARGLDRRARLASSYRRQVDRRDLRIVVPQFRRPSKPSWYRSMSAVIYHSSVQPWTRGTRRSGGPRCSGAALAIEIDHLPQPNEWNSLSRASLGRCEVVIVDRLCREPKGRFHRATFKRVPGAPFSQEPLHQDERRSSLAELMRPGVARSRA